MLARENRKSSVRFGRITPSEASSFQHPPIENILDRWANLGRVSISQPVTGIFYIVRLPSGWKCASFRDDEVPGEPGHPDVWVGPTGVAAYVARMWSARLGRSARHLYDGLEKCCYCFPRGRVTFADQLFNVLNGGDFTPRMRISRARVEQIFGVKGHAEWSFDEHERCLSSDVEEIRGLLDLTETWPAFS